jgi:hypothetical protein
LKWVNAEFWDGPLDGDVREVREDQAFIKISVPFEENDWDPHSLLGVMDVGAMNLAEAVYRRVSHWKVGKGPNTGRIYFQYCPPNPPEIQDAWKYG